jgi:hypothetical protein
MELANISEVTRVLSADHQRLVDFIYVVRAHCDKTERAVQKCQDIC